MGREAQSPPGQGGRSPLYLAPKWEERVWLRPCSGHRQLGEEGTVGLPRDWKGYEGSFKPLTAEREKSSIPSCSREKYSI